MSLDLWLQHPKCTTCNHVEEPVVSLNSTYNCSCMWYLLFPDAENFVEIEGLTGKDAARILKVAISRAIESRKDLEKLNPVNGWGSYETFLKFLRDILAASQDYPNLVWSADR